MCHVARKALQVGLRLLVSLAKDEHFHSYTVAPRISRERTPFTIVFRVTA